MRIRTHNIRDYAHDRHRTTDDYPFGGGGGMVLKPEPLFLGVEGVRMGIADEGSARRAEDAQVILLSPQGEVLTQGIVEELTSHRDIILICGRYEGVDERGERVPGRPGNQHWGLRAERWRDTGDGGGRRVWCACSREP